MTNKELQEILRCFPDNAIIIGSFDYGGREIDSTEVMTRADGKLIITGY